MTGRRHEVLRVESFSDAVFAFALTLLVVSLEVPKDFDHLWNLVRHLVPFALMFAMVCWIWYEHNAFFRRYGLQDGPTIALNSVLLFVVLFYVYPLKFLVVAGLGGAFHIADAPHIEGGRDTRILMLLYSSGLCAIFLTFTLLYAHAWRRRVVLMLSPIETVELRASLRGHALTAGIGAASILIASLNEHWVGFAGLIYFLIGPALTWNGMRAGKQRARFETSPPSHAKR